MPIVLQTHIVVVDQDMLEMGNSAVPEVYLLNSFRGYLLMSSLSPII